MPSRAASLLLTSSNVSNLASSRRSPLWAVPAGQLLVLKLDSLPLYVAHLGERTLGRPALDYKGARLPYGRHAAASLLGSKLIAQLGRQTSPKRCGPSELGAEINAYTLADAALSVTRSTQPGPRCTEDVRLIQRWPWPPRWWRHGALSIKVRCMGGAGLAAGEGLCDDVRCTWPTRQRWRRAATTLGESVTWNKEPPAREAADSVYAVRLFAVVPVRGLPRRPPLTIRGQPTKRFGLHPPQLTPGAS